MKNTENAPFAPREIKLWQVLLRLLPGVLCVVALLGLGYGILALLGYTDLSREALQELIAGTGGYGVMVFILISFLQVTFVPIPGAVTILAGGMLFGFWLGALYSLIGILLGAIVAFALGRCIGRRFVDWAAGGHETVDYYLDKCKGRENVLLFFMFLLPAFPDDALCAVAGITHMRWPVFLSMQIITRPVSILGTLLFMSGEFIPYTGWGLAVILFGLGLSLVAFVLSYRHAQSLDACLTRFCDHLRRKKR